MKKFNIIYSDPPWPVGGTMDWEKHFPLMSYEDINSLDVKSIAADDAYLFLWIMSSTIPYATAVMEAWGFDYKGIAFVWEKVNGKGEPNMGMGTYTRQSVELCLLGIRGKPMSKLGLKARDVMQLQRIPRAGLRFAEKPQVFRDEIKRLCGAKLPALEMFARVRTPGWSVWGNEVDCDVEIGDTRERFTEEDALRDGASMGDSR